MKKIQLTLMYHALNAKCSHRVKKSFRVVAYGEAHDGSQNFTVDPFEHQEFGFADMPQLISI